MIKIKTVITSIQSVWVTRPTWSHLGAIRACLGPVGGFMRTFCGFEASVRQYEYELIGFRTAFWPPNITQKGFCTQDFSMDLSFQEKKKQQAEAEVVLSSRSVKIKFS